MRTKPQGHAISTKDIFFVKYAGIQATTKNKKI
jgi:hypothetical protein